MKIAHPEAAFREAAEEACRSIGAMVETYVCPSSRTVLGRGAPGLCPAGGDGTWGWGVSHRAARGGRVGGARGLTLGRLPVCCPSVSSLVRGVVE